MLIELHSLHDCPTGLTMHLAVPVGQNQPQETSVLFGVAKATGITLDLTTFSSSRWIDPLRVRNDIYDRGWFVLGSGFRPQ